MEWRVIVRTVGWTQKGGRRRRKKVNKVHEGGESSKSSRRQRMAAQLAVRKHSPHRRAGRRGEAVRVSACVVWMLNNNKKIIIRKWSFLNLSHREKSNGARARGGERREREKRVGGG